MSLLISLILIALGVLTSNLSYGQENLLLNPSFEKGWESWVRNNFENSLDTFTTEWKDAHEGVFSFKVARSGGQVDTAWYILSEPMRILGDKLYILTFWSKYSLDLIRIGPFDEGHPYDTRIEWLNDQGGLISTLKFKFGATNTIWHQDRVEAQAPGNASYAQVRFGFDWPDLFDGNYLIIDDISFTGPPGLTTTTTTSSTSTTTTTTIIPPTNVSPEQPSAEEKGEIAPCIVQAGFNLTRLNLSSVAGGKITIGVTVVGGKAPVSVEAFLDMLNILGQIPFQSIGLLKDPDGDSLYELEFPNIPPGALPPGETEIPGFGIIARDSRGIEDAWPSLTIGGPGTL